MSSSAHRHAGHAHDHAAHDHDDHDHQGHDHGHKPQQDQAHGHDHDHAKPKKAAHDHAHHDHGHSHGHGHSHHHGSSSERRLTVALALIGIFMLVEVAGGFIAHSLALIADAGHMLTDGASLVLALFALRVGKRPADEIFSYGRQRYEVLAAFVNGLVLLALSAWILVEAAVRVFQPQPVQGMVMLVVAGLGFLANIASFLVLRDGGDSLNMRSALLHVLSDLMASAAAMVAAGIILLTGWTLVDPLLSALVSLLIVRGGWRVVRESAHILLEGSPSHIDPAEVAADLVAQVPGVGGIHHLHAWSLTDNRPMMTLHAVVAEGTDQDAVLASIQNRLNERFSVVHATVQLEREGCDDHAGDGCHSHT